MREQAKELLELLDKSGASLFSLLTRLTLREDVAEELMQELFIKLNNTKKLYKVRNPSAYTHRIAINLALDWWRSRKCPPLSLEQINEPASDSNSALTDLVRMEELQELLKAMGRLNGSYRQVLVMRYIQEESYERIAEQTGKTPHHVRAMCSRALNQLRDTLGVDRSQSYGKGAKNV